MIIGLVGRTNVGKSTLFNRLIGTYRAIVTDVAGTTRELLREEVDFYGKAGILVDSPGLEDFELEKGFIQQIINEADMLLFMVDGKADVGEEDQTIKDMIIHAGKKASTILVVNKLDGHVYGRGVESLLADWYALGFSKVLPLSAKQEEGVVEVADALLLLSAQGQKDDLRESKKPQSSSDVVSIAFVGRPNVGKSTLMNTLVGDEVARVQDQPGTTLDYISADMSYHQTILKLYDTAGIRKKGKTVGLEKIAYSKTMKMIERIKPIVIILIDVDEGLTHRDKSLIGELMMQGVPLVVAANKVDLYTPTIADKKVEAIRHALPGGDWIPVVKISGQDGLGLPALLDKVIHIQKSYAERISTSELNSVMNKAWLTSPPRFPKNKICKRKYVTQVDTAPPKFLLSVNNEQYVNFAFKKWLENVIRKAYGFVGIPLQFTFSSKVKENPYLEK